MRRHTCAYEYELASYIARQRPHFKMAARVPYAVEFLGLFFPKAPSIRRTALRADASASL